MNKKNDDQLSALERQLAALDLSDQSEIKDSLRHELLQKIAARRRGTSRGGRYTWRWNMFRKPLPAMALGIVIGVAVLALVHPDTRASLASFLKMFKVGENTFIYQSGTVGEAVIDSMLAEMDKSLEKGERYHLDNEYGGWGGLVPKGKEPVIKQVASLSLAARMVDYPLQVPSYYHEMIPASFRFRKAEILPDGSSILYFGIGPFETMLKHSPVGGGRSVTSATSIMTTDADGTREMRGVEPQIEELEIAGKKVVWQIHDPYTLRGRGRFAQAFPDSVIGKFIWEADGVSYVLDGKTLTKSEGRKIIESLRPTRVRE